MTESQLQDLSQFEQSEHFSDAEKLALRFALAVSATPPTVTDSLFEELRSHYNEAALVELAAVGAFENCLARFNRVFAVEPVGFSEGAYCPLPDHPVDAAAAQPSAAADLG